MGYSPWDYKELDMIEQLNPAHFSQLRCYALSLLSSSLPTLPKTASLHCFFPHYHVYSYHNIHLNLGVLSFLFTSYFHFLTLKQNLHKGTKSVYFTYCQVPGI